MTANPLMRFRPEEPQRNVWDHVEMLNKMTWVRASGRLYFVGERRKEDGTIEHFVDRAA